MKNWEITSEEIREFGPEMSGDEIPFDEVDFENWLDV